jgi:choline dehydrogenase-like flavoprotein
MPRNVLNGVRMNTAMTYLTPSVRGRANLTVLGDTFVRRVLFEGTRAMGVETERAGEPVAFRADKVILSAGAIKTPHLLMLSGIGPAEALHKHGIGVVHDSPGVGRNVKDHPLVFSLFDVDRTPLPEDCVIAHTVLHHTAPGSNQPSDLEVHWARAQNMLHIAIVLNIASSSGEISLISRDPTVPPRINLNYLSDPADLPRLTANVRIALELLQSRAFGRLKIKRLAPLDTEATADAALERWIRANLATAMHTHNSTAMGHASDPTAVVDQRCRVHGVEGLRVADIGIVPLIRRGPAATAVMIGERVAALVDDDT